VCPRRRWPHPTWSRGSAPKVGAGKVDQLIGAAVQHCLHHVEALAKPDQFVVPPSHPEPHKIVTRSASLARIGDQLAIVAACAEEVGRDRQHWHARAMAVEQAVNEMQVARATASGAYREAAAEMRIDAGRECRDLQVDDRQRAEAIDASRRNYRTGFGHRSVSQSHADVGNEDREQGGGLRGAGILAHRWMLPGGPKKLRPPDRSSPARAGPLPRDEVRAPANVVPGISFSPGKMLRARLFSYGDTQRYRLGVNFNHIPVNAPKSPFQSNHRDGKMRSDGNLGGTTSFHPNSADLWANQPDFAEPPMPVDGDGTHWDHRVDDDHWEQPGNLFRKMPPAQQQLLVENTARAWVMHGRTSSSAISRTVCGRTHTGRAWRGH
jgi:hypothetical protein